MFVSNPDLYLIGLVFKRFYASSVRLQHPQQAYIDGELSIRSKLTAPLHEQIVTAHFGLMDGAGLLTHAALYFYNPICSDLRRVRLLVEQSLVPRVQAFWIKRCLQLDHLL